MTDASRLNATATVPSADESVWTLAAFWLIAFAAAGLFAAVLLAPKWEEKLRLERRVLALAADCAYQNDSNDHLRRVVDAFQHDPEFTAELARFELNYSATDEQRIPAPVEHWERPKRPKKLAAPDPLWMPLLRAFAHDRIARRAALLTAAIFVIVGLAFFGSAHEP